MVVEHFQKMLKNEIEFSSLIILWESYFWELKLLLLPANTTTEVPTTRGGVPDPRAAPAMPQQCRSALRLPCFAEF